MPDDTSDPDLGSGSDVAPAPATSAPAVPIPTATPPAQRARDAADRLRRSAGAATGPLVGGVSSAVGAAVGAAVGGIRQLPDAVRDLPETLRELPGSRVRRVRRLSALPLPSLYRLHPQARQARPIEIGLRTLDIGDLRGTAVGGGDQRGADYLPLKPFRGPNWRARWQRLRRAQDRLVDLPPIDVVKYDGGYWVLDGHNRVALALYGGQVAIDASVVELVPPGGRRTEPIGTLVTEVESSRAVRGRVDAQTTAKGSAATDPTGDGR